VPESFSGIRGEYGDILVLVDEQHIVFGQFKAAEELFVQWAGADDIDPVTLQQPVQVTAQFRVTGGQR
jgi:hypothetical protein